MKRIFLGAFVLSGVLLCSCSESEGKQDEPQTPAEEQPAETKAYNDVEPLEALKWWTPSSAEKTGLGAIADFAYTLNGAVVDGYDKLWPADRTGNYSVSPVSVSVFLSALSQCVDGEAREDLCKMLGLNGAEASELNNKLLRYLNKDEEYMQVSIANSVWHVADMPITEEYTQRMARQFGAPVNILDLYSPEAVEVLNGWCGDKTHGMINDIFHNAPNIDFILANALYFSSSWLQNFNEKMTEKAPFAGMNGKTEVDMMHRTLETAYTKADGVEYINLSFNGDYTMEIIMPAAGTDMDAFGKGLSAAEVSRLEGAAKYGEVDFRLPKFKDNHQTDILNILTTLGYPAYDLPTFGMTGSTGFPLLYESSRIVHATALNVNEKGAELAAVTVGGWATSSGDDPKLEHFEMTVDRPFYYIIRNRTCNAVLMMGRVCNL